MNDTPSKQRSHTAGTSVEVQPVLHVIDTGGPGGAETVFAELALGLDDYGYSAIPVIGRDDWLAQRLRRHGVEPVIVPANRGGLTYLRDLRRLIAAKAPVAIVAHLLGAATYASLAAALTSTPCIAVFHGQKDLDQSRGNRLKGRLLSLPKGRAVFVSEALRDELKTRLGLRERRCTVIPNGVDVQRFSDRRSTFRASLGLDDNAIVVAAVGNVRTPKGYEVLLRAAAQAVGSNPRLCFVVAGDKHAALFPPLEALHAELGLGDAFRFLGLVEDIPGLLGSADVFVLSSHEEGFSIACIEAMASGLPVVATKSGGPESIVVDGATGFLVPPADPDALARPILELSNDPALRQKLGEAGRQRAAGEFSTAGFLRRYADLLGEIIQR